MESQIPMQRALLSVSSKDGIVEFAKALSQCNYELISTGGTAKALLDAGLNVITVECLTGYPEMLDGRVKTLHPVVHGGLLGVRDNPSHLEAMKEHGITPIDLVCIDLYPFEKTIANANATTEECIEQIDIGGPAMIRSAAKNHRFVTVVTNPNQYARVLSDLDSNNGETSIELRTALAQEAFTRTAEYDRLISHWMSGEQASFPKQLCVQGKLEQMLRYGENPDQAACVYQDPQFTGPSVVSASTIAGKPLSFNNLMDAAAALELVLDLKACSQEACAAVIKHANPCGAAVKETIIQACNAAWKCDPLAAFGGIVALSEHVDNELAKAITEGEKFLEVIVAPAFSNEAVETLSNRWKNIRLLAYGENDRQPTWRQLRSIEGGFLIQDCAPIQADTASWEHVAGPKPTTAQLQDAQLAWITCSHLKSNAISIVDCGALIGGGMGQVDRVSAARLAIQRAGKQLALAKSPVAGSDAFFPFSDGPELLIDAGIKCIVQPGGSKRDQETIDLCKSRNVTLLHTATRCFRH